MLWLLLTSLIIAKRGGEDYFWVYSEIGGDDLQYNKNSDWLKRGECISQSLPFNRAVICANAFYGNTRVTVYKGENCNGDSESNGVVYNSGGKECDSLGAFGVYRDLSKSDYTNLYRSLRVG
jgi:hypothetical protein